MLRMKRVYEEAEKADHYRILVDRIWPRGLSKEKANLDEWEKEIAPSTELRKAFNHDPKKFDQFKKDYLAELKENHNSDEFVETIRKQLKKGNVTLVYAAKDVEHNQVVVLLEFLASKGIDKAEKKNVKKIEPL
ncbi:MAG: DUF488 domain-containing protein [Carnobacterium sp.]|uniref:DUF488 domain-containing protein n=2 Tax=Carnobacterium TaxID=2747 RepID=A0ABW4NQR8_9LACT|nr:MULTISPECIES: DUF488 domain-containing protein [unclassified Carnobacterium]ALV21207.1 uroporphyrin-III c-methyltransferase [Carnobacterium sp. CP1]QQP71337.1 DUF488 domain-containing protein [Carnobacterium sp. CS13]